MFTKIGFSNGIELDDVQVFFSGKVVIANILNQSITSEKVALTVLKKLRNDKVVIEKELSGHKTQYTVKSQEKRDSLDFRAEGDLFQLAIIDKMIDIVIDFNNFDDSKNELDESEVLSNISDFMENNLFFTFPDLTIEKVVNCGLEKKEVLFILEKAIYDARSELSSHQPSFRTRGGELLTLKFKTFGDKCHINALESLMNKVIVAYNDN